VIKFINAQIEETIDTFRRLQADHLAIETVAKVGAVCALALHQGHKIMLAGNGGSAADAQHIAAEFVSRLAIDRAPLAALALTTDTSILTATANDYGYEQVFARQVQGLGKGGDVLIAISTSGKSKSILVALGIAREIGITTVGLTGATDSPMLRLCDLVIRVPSTRTQNCQELHIMIGHTICAIAEKEFVCVAGTTGDME